MGNETPPIPALCQTAKDLISNHVIIAVHIGMITQSIFALLALGYVSWLVARHKVFHINLRFTLTALNLMLMLRTFTSMIRSGKFLSGLSESDPCELPWSKSRCKAFSDIVSNPIISLSYAYLSVAVERCIALILRKRYERITRPYLGVIGFTAVWAEYISVVITGFKILLDFSPPSDVNVAYCASTSAAVITFSSILTVFRFIPISGVSIIIFIGISIYIRIHNNRWQRTSKHSLAIRFQERITLRTTHIVVPNAIIFFVFYILSLLATTWSSITVNNHGDLFGALIIKEYASFLYNFYGLLYPFIFLRIEPALRQKQEEFTKEDCTNYDYGDLSKQWERRLVKLERHTNSSKKDGWFYKRTYRPTRVSQSQPSTPT